MGETKGLLGKIKEISQANQKVKQETQAADLSRKGREEALKKSIAAEVLAKTPKATGQPRIEPLFPMTPEAKENMAKTDEMLAIKEANRAALRKELAGNPTYEAMKAAADQEK